MSKQEDMSGSHEGEKYYTLVQASVDSIVVVDHQGTVLFANQATGELFCLDSQKLKGHNFGFPIQRDPVLEIQIPCRKGVVKTAELRSVKTEWEGKIAYVCNIRDITDRKEAEQALAKSEEILQLTGEMAKVGGWEVDLKTEKVYWTRQTRLIHEVPENFEPSLQEAIRFFPGGSGIKIRRAVNLAIKEGKSYDLEVEFRTAKGRDLWVRAIGRPTMQGGKCIRLNGSFKDITQRKRAEMDLQEKNEEVARQNEEYLATNEELRESLERIREINEALEEARNRAEESDRLKAAFLANLSHEIRTPMNGILGFANLLRKPGLTNEKTGQYISIIEESGKRLLAIIRDLVEISKIEAEQLKVSVDLFNINRTLEELTAFMEPECKRKGLELHCYKALPDEHAFVQSDQTKVQQILSNLLKNAIKFTDSGFIKLGYQARDGQVRFYVRDTGIGIPLDQQQMIFERFSQGKDPGFRNPDGAGLGLSISKAYVELLGGEMHVESAPGQGSLFSFYLPLTLRQEPSRQEDSDTGDVLERVSGKLQKPAEILLVEDDSVCASYLKELLEPYKITLHIAKEGGEALRMIEKLPSINLVLMDMKMPGMDGSEATRKVKAVRPELPVIIQTAFTGKEDKENALRAGADDYIVKPLDPDRIAGIFQCYLTVPEL